MTDSDGEVLMEGEDGEEARARIMDQLREQAEPSAAEQFKQMVQEQEELQEKQEAEKAQKEAQKRYLCRKKLYGLIKLRCPILQDFFKGIPSFHISYYFFIQLSFFGPKTFAFL